MQLLHWELHVLTRAIHYPNLSGASAHVGISQPQLSRIISKLEEELQLTLLDRTARRKSGWTPSAYKLAEIYTQSMRHLSLSMQHFVEGSTPKSIRIGTLEGVLQTAVKMCHLFFKEIHFEHIELNAYDLSELEEHFQNNSLDIIMTSREPGRKKYKNKVRLGYQTLNYVENFGKNLNKSESTDHTFVFSSFEWAQNESKKRILNKSDNTKNKNEKQKIFLSNSLEIRKLWLEKFEGKGFIPSVIQKNKPTTPNVESVYLISSDEFHPKVFEKIKKIVLEFD